MAVNPARTKTIILPEGFACGAFRKRLLEWWESGKRNYPWRETRNPYDILIAEVLLHRTRADQVVPVYQQFLQQYPSVSDVARASAGAIGKIIKPLGLHWRIELLHDMARELHERFGGKIPQDREGLESLPGISHYIATAVRCFAFGYPDALLDTNTVRISGRLFGLQVNDGSRRNKSFRVLLENLVDPGNPRDSNYALLDLGALICRSRNPLCPECPVSGFCRYGMQDR